jgi:D-alanyl-D-alanine carboxypeptidase
MHRPPPHERQESEQATTHQTSQHRIGAIGRGNRHKDIYSDEHPEIPKILRASLQQNTPQPGSSTRSAQSDDPPDTPAKSTRLRKAAKRASSEPGELPDISPSTGKLASSEPRTRSSRLQEDEYEQDGANTRTSSAYQSAYLSRRSSSDIYEPPSRRRRYRSTSRRHSQPLYDPPGRLQTLVQKRSFLFIALALLALLIIVPVLASGLLKQPSPPHIITADSTQPNKATNTPVVIAPTADPRQLIIVPSNTDHPPPPVYASSAYLLDADTGATLYAYNPFIHLPMLSTTKLMTAMVALEIGKLDQTITITDAIQRDLNRLSADSSVMTIKKGETYTLRDLLYGLMLFSGNDAAIVIADGLSGSLPKFVARMNERAARLGLRDTHFMNPHGLLMKGHYSSAHDLAMLGKYSMDVPLIRQISSTKEYHIPKSKSHAEHFLFNTNQFLWWYPGVDGGKTGWDGEKNFLQVISCKRNNRHLIGVTMHTSDWWTDMRDLMNWGFNNFKWISPADLTQTQVIPFSVDWNYFAKDKKENTIPTADKGRYYIYTGYSVSGMILAYFDKNKGLKKFGYPTGMPKIASETAISQKFERGTIQCDITTKQCTTR